MRLIPEESWPIITIWMEARGESYEGKVGVAEVIYRRTKEKVFSDGTYVGTCLRDRQFSGWNERDPNRIPGCKLDTDEHVVQDCIRAWTEAKAGSNVTKGATHYYSMKMYVAPYWEREMDETTVIGNHRFMKKKEGG